MLISSVFTQLNESNRRKRSYQFTTSTEYYLLYITTNILSTASYYITNCILRQVLFTAIVKINYQLSHGSRDDVRCPCSVLYSTIVLQQFQLLLFMCYCCVTVVSLLYHFCAIATIQLLLKRDKSSQFSLIACLVVSDNRLILRLKNLLIFAENFLSANCLGPENP